MLPGTMPGSPSCADWAPFRCTHRALVAEALVRDVVVVAVPRGAFVLFAPEHVEHDVAGAREQPPSIGARVRPRHFASARYATPSVSSEASHERPLGPSLVPFRT